MMRWINFGLIPKHGRTSARNNLAACLPVARAHKWESAKGSRALSLQLSLLGKGSSRDGGGTRSSTHLRPALLPPRQALVRAERRSSRRKFPDALENATVNTVVLDWCKNA